MKLVFRQQREWCTKTHCVLFCLLKQHFEKCVLVLDFRRLTPDLLQEWSKTMIDHCGAAQKKLFFADVKPWRTRRPGAGKAANEVIRQVGNENVNLVQMAH